MSTNPATCHCGQWEYDEYGECCPSCPPRKVFDPCEFREELGNLWGAAERLTQGIAKVGEGELGHYHDEIPGPIADELDSAWIEARRLQARLRGIVRRADREMC